MVSDTAEEKKKRKKQAKKKENEIWSHRAEQHVIYDRETCLKLENCGAYFIRV